MKKDLSLMLKNMCCSICKADFDSSSIKYLYTDGDYNVVNLNCNKCGKDFGTVFLKLEQKESTNQNELILNDIRNKPAINTDDVLDAHKQIKEFEKNWQNFLNN